jgi:4-amino-4-deoxy-L-arabinose transferase-like glycosyltransferase
VNRRKANAYPPWILLLLAAWALWLWGLDASDLTFDETATYFVAYRSLPGIITYLQGAVREHPPLYYLLIRCWMGVAGTGEFSLRFFSVGVGVIALAATGWAARQTRSSLGFARGLVPAILLAATPGVAYYARDARMYALNLVWVALSTGLFLRDWLPTRGWPRPVAILALTAVHLLALSTHYYLLLPLLVQPLALLAMRRRRPLAAWCGVHALPALAGLAWLWLAPGFRMTGRSMWQGMGLELPSSFETLHLLGKLIFSPVVQVPFRSLYLLLALAGAGILLALWRRRGVGVWLALAALVPLLLAFQIPHPPVARYVIFLSLPAGMALAFPITTLLVQRRRWIAWLPAAFLALVLVTLLVDGGMAFTLAHDRSHYGRTLRAVEAHVRPGDGLLFYGPWQIIPFHYYDPGGLPAPVYLPPHAPPHLDPAEAEPVLEELLARHDRVWVVPAAVDAVDPQHFAAGWLNTHAHGVWRDEALDFSLYVVPLPAGAPAQELDVDLSDTLRLERVAWEPAPLRPGQPLRLTLFWRPLRPLEEDVEIRLELVDRSGHAWDHLETIPGRWLNPPSRWEPERTVVDYEGLMVPAGIPPGDYVVRLTAAGATVDLATLPVADAAGASEPAQEPRATFCAPAGQPCVSLESCEPGGVRFQQGYPLPFRLHWRAPADPLPELEVRWRLVHRPLPLGVGARTIASGTLDLVPGYPAPAWAPVRRVTLPLAPVLPVDAATGRAQLVVQVLGPSGTPWPTEGRGSEIALFDVVVEPRPVLRRLPRGLTRSSVDFGDDVALRGYRVEGDPRPGGRLTLTYAWYAREQPQAIYAVFNHLETEDGTPVAQADGWPQEGLVLSTQWQPGDYVEDTYTLSIPAGAPPGPYHLYTGLYEAATGDRLPAYEDGQRLPADRVPVPLPGQEER